MGRYGDFESLSKEESLAISNLARSQPSQRDDGDPVTALVNLASWNRHILALRQTLIETEKIAFGTTKYDPRQMRELYEQKIYPFYAKSMKNNGDMSVWMTSGISSVSSLFPDATGELGFYVESPWNDLFRSNESP